MDLEPDGIVPPDTDQAVGNDALMREIEAMLEDGRLEQGLEAIDQALASGDGHRIDLQFLRGDACLGLGLSSDAERSFRLVLEQDPDCPASNCWLAMSLYLQWRFEEAEAAARLARELPDALVDADVVLGCVLERRGEFDEAEGLFERAASGSPDKYTVPVRLERRAFDLEVRKAVRLLPRQFRQSLDRVPVVVQDLPDETLAAGPDSRHLAPDMLGLFDGIPLTETEDFDGPLRPNTIYLFQRNLERMAADREELVEQIRITLFHELGHYLGFEEDDMDELGLA